MQGPTTISFREQHSRALRLWHWLTFIVVTGSLLTILVLKTVLNGRPMIRVIQQHDAAISQEGARAIAGTLRDEVWTIHVYLGVTLAVLFLFRLILEAFQPAGQGFFLRIRNARTARRAGTPRAGHYWIVKMIYAAFYLLLAVIAVTGLWLIYSDDFKWLHDGERTVKEIHNICMYVMLGFIAIHIGGVLLEELRGGKGVVSDMINGGQQDNSGQ